VEKDLKIRLYLICVSSNAKMKAPGRTRYQVLVFRKKKQARRCAKNVGQVEQSEDLRNSLSEIRGKRRVSPFGQERPDEGQKREIKSK